MKTSVNIPDWLHDEVRQLAPDTPFGEQVRDALLIALPVWHQDSRESALKRALRAKLREIEAEQAANRHKPPAASRAAAKRYSAGRVKPAPASPQARRRVEPRPSAAKKAAEFDRQLRSGRKLP